MEGGNFVRRWTGFVAAMWLMIFSGSYGFANYSTALKAVMGISQAQLNRLSVAKDLGDSLGVVAGILSNHLPPSALLCIGATVALFGYGLLFLVISQTIQPLPYWMVNQSTPLLQQHHPHFYHFISITPLDSLSAFHMWYIHSYIHTYICDGYEMIKVLLLL